MQSLQQWTAAKLLNDIVIEGKYPRGSKIPSIPAIQSDFDVGRNTVLYALDLLSDSELVVKQTLFDLLDHGLMFHGVSPAHRFKSTVKGVRV